MKLLFKVYSECDFIEFLVASLYFSPFMCVNHSLFFRFLKLGETTPLFLFIFNLKKMPKCLKSGQHLRGVLLNLFHTSSCWHGGCWHSQCRGYSMERVDILLKSPNWNVYKWNWIWSLQNYCNMKGFLMVRGLNYLLSLSISIMIKVCISIVILQKVLRP